MSLAQSMFSLVPFSDTISGPGVAPTLPQYVAARGRREIGRAHV